MAQTVAGIEPGQRQLNGPQTTGRDYRNLSEPEYEMGREVDLAVPTRDGTIVQAEREDLYDLVEWAAAQPWIDGNVGMIGISYFAMTQLEAASERPPHLKAIFPF